MLVYVVLVMYKAVSTPQIVHQLCVEAHKTVSRVCVLWRVEYWWFHDRSVDMITPKSLLDSLQMIGTL